LNIFFKIYYNLKLKAQHNVKTIALFE
jgi:hypothetical protein